MTYRSEISTITLVSGKKKGGDLVSLLSEWTVNLLQMEYEHLIYLRSVK